MTRRRLTDNESRNNENMSRILGGRIDKRKGKWLAVTTHPEPHVISCPRLEEAIFIVLEDLILDGWAAVPKDRPADA